MRLRKSGSWLSGKVRFQVQTGCLQDAGMHLLCIKRLIYMSHAVCWLPTWLDFSSYTLDCQVLYKLDLSHYVISLVLVFVFVFFFSNARSKGQGSIDEFSEQAAICLNKALFSIPRVLAPRPSSPPVAPGTSFPQVPARFYSGSWKADSSLPLGFSSQGLICLQVNSKQKEDDSWILCP